MCRPNNLLLRTVCCLLGGKKWNESINILQTLLIFSYVASRQKNLMGSHKFVGTLVVVGLFNL